MGVKKNRSTDLGRRDFMKLCSTVAVVLGLGPAGAREVYAAFTAGTKIPVIWLHFAECTGCTESFLRLANPWIDEILFDIISLEYHETLMTNSNDTINSVLYEAADKYSGEFICIAEGSIPTAENGTFGMIGGKTMLEIAKYVCPKAKALITYGNCSSFGGIVAAAPNPTGAKGVLEAVPEISAPTIKMPGCAPNPVNFAALLSNYLMKGTWPSCDEYGRPDFAYEDPVHQQCEFDSENRCSEDYGCKGMACMNNCPTVNFNDESNPLIVGHPCIGCSEPEFWDTMSPFYVEFSGGGRYDYKFDPKWYIAAKNLVAVQPEKKNRKVYKKGLEQVNIKGQRIKNHTAKYHKTPKYNVPENLR